MTAGDNRLEFVDRMKALARDLNKEEAPDWLRELRRQGLCRLEALGLPPLKDEEWKYTDISPLTAPAYILPTRADLSEKEAFQDYCRGDDIRVVFVNGFFSKDLSSLQASPPGLKIATLEEMTSDDRTSLQKLFFPHDSADESVFTAMNKALTHQGIYIDISENVAVRPLIHVVHVAALSKGDVLTLPRTFIRLDALSEATILESHVSFSDENTYLAGAVTDISLGERSVLDYSRAQRESLKAYHVGTTRVWQERDSSFDGFFLAAGGRLTRHDLHVVINGRGASAGLKGLYIVGRDQHVDNHTSVDHRVPDGTSHQLYKGILNGSARAVFNGKILVRPLAQKTNAYQLNKNLLLGRDCRVDTRPQLEISADDVKCTHGATIGQINEDEIFYLQTRCIPHKEAVRLLVRGFADDLLNTVRHPFVAQAFSQLLKPAWEVSACA